MVEQRSVLYMWKNSKYTKVFIQSPKFIKIFASSLKKQTKKPQMKPLKIRIWKLMLYKCRIALKLQDLRTRLMPKDFRLCMNGLKTHHIFKAKEKKTKSPSSTAPWHFLLHANPKIHPNLHLAAGYYFTIYSNNSIFKTALFKKQYI